MDEIKLIKKKYGEDMSKLCRKLFSTILEEEGVLLKILLDNFNPSHFLYEDIINTSEGSFKDYIYTLIEDEEPTYLKTDKTVIELLDSVGYNFYECKCEEDIQSFKKYYAKGEELCTFLGDRLKTNEVFFAVKKDVDNILREDFKNPKRQDRYGTSVISIQFSKDEAHTLSIKNRYNHKVINPDATYSNDLENIVKGLTYAFIKDYNLEQKKLNNSFELPGYVRANDGKYYKYNIEINNIYYCPDNIIIDNFKVKKYDKERFIIFDNYILDLKNKTITSKIENDAFISSLGKIKKINIVVNKNKQIQIINEDNISIIISIDNKSNIISYQNDDIEEIKDNFLKYNKTLQEFNAKNLKIIGNYFLYNNKNLKKLELVLLEEVGNCFLNNNIILEKVKLDNLKKVGINFLISNEGLEELILNNIESIGDRFLTFNENIKLLICPKLKEVGEHFLRNNYFLTSIILESLEKAGDYFLEQNKKISNVYLPRLKEVGSSFLRNNEDLEELVLPELISEGGEFLFFNKILKVFISDKLMIIGNNFLASNQGLTYLNLAKVLEIGDDFMPINNTLKTLILPNTISVGENFLIKNEVLDNIIMPNLKKAGLCFLYNYLDKNNNYQYIRKLVS